MTRPLRIGISACFFHADPERPVFKGKTLLYLEQSLSDWVMSDGMLPFLVPTVAENAPLSMAEVIADMDGVVLHGGADVAPESYGETPLRPEWSGDAVRDRYEIALVKACMAQNKPVLGICRGQQLLNVALGGTLYQDIETQVPGARVHRDADIYDQNFHEIRIEERSLLSRLHPGRECARINSVHHQAIKDLAPGLEIEARSVDDGVIEAVRWNGPSFVYGFQWHPEWQVDEPGPGGLLSGKPLLGEFRRAAERRKAG